MFLLFASMMERSLPDMDDSIGELELTYNLEGELSPTQSAPRSESSRPCSPSATPEESSEKGHSHSRSTRKFRFSIGTDIQLLMEIQQHRHPFLAGPSSEVWKDVGERMKEKTKVNAIEFSPLFGHFKFPWL